MRFCIVGTGRCGSTLLQRMMNDHPDIFVYNETHWIPEMYKRFRTKKSTLQELRSIAENTHHVDGTPTFNFHESYFEGMRTDLTIREFCDHIGKAVARESNKKFWADKTPDYGYFLAPLQQLWPDCKFIHIVRFGPHVIDSMSKHPGYQTLACLNQLNWCDISYNFPGNLNFNKDIQLNNFLTIWYSRLKTTKEQSQKLSPENYLEIKYEEFFEHSEHILKDLSSFLDVRDDPAWIARASSLVDKKRKRKSTPQHILNLFKKKEQALLNVFGYELL